MEIVYVAGGCLWGVQAFMQTLPGVLLTEAGRANGTTHTLNSNYDGYVECVKVGFDAETLPITALMHYLFEIIAPYSENKQGIDVGEKYRTGIYSKQAKHLAQAQQFIDERQDKALVTVEVLPLRNYVRSADEHQDRLRKHPNDYCHIPYALLNKYS